MDRTLLWQEFRILEQLVVVNAGLVFQGNTVLHLNHGPGLIDDLGYVLGEDDGFRVPWVPGYQSL